MWKSFDYTEDSSSHERDKNPKNVGDSSERSNKVEDAPYVSRHRRSYATPGRQRHLRASIDDTDVERLRAGTPAPQAAYAATTSTAPPQPRPQTPVFDAVIFPPTPSHRSYGGGSSSPYERRRTRPNRDPQNGKIPQCQPSCASNVPQRLPVEEPANDPRRLSRQPSEPPASRATAQGVKRRRN